MVKKIEQDPYKKALLGLDNDSESDGDSETANETANEVVRDEHGRVTSIGKVVTAEQEAAIRSEQFRQEGLKIGFIDIDPSDLPSKGYFYPENIKVRIRAAQFEEMKHYATLIENNQQSVNKHINQIGSECVEVFINDIKKSFEDLKSFDKIFVIFAIRDKSMLAHGREKKLTQKGVCEKCGESLEREIDKNSFGYYKISDKMMKFYDPVERCFNIHLDSFKSENPIKLYVPSIGCENWVLDYVRRQETKKMRGENVFYDADFAAKLQFLIQDHRVLSDDFVTQKYSEYKKWSYDKHMACIKAIDALKLGIKPNIELVCSRDKHVNSVPVFFRNGYRSLFDFSNIEEDLFID